MDTASTDKLLTTTRSVRKRLDLQRPVEPEVIQACIKLALQAPTGGNRQSWAFVVVTDAEKRAAIAHYYRQSWQSYVQETAGRPNANATAAQMQRVGSSANYLAEHLQQVPVHVIPCYQGRVEQAASVLAQASFYGSILPAAWSLMLALRSRGIGSAWTTLHLRYEREIGALLAIPDDVTQTALLPVAYYTGDDFKPAQRTPAPEVTFWDAWGETR
jgi:nitroreductase